MTADLFEPELLIIGMDDVRSDAEGALVVPVDLAAVQVDDALLDLLGSGARLISGDDELARVLIAWRREVLDEPVGLINGGVW